MRQIKTYRLKGRVTSSSYPYTINGDLFWAKFGGGQLSPVFKAGEFITNDSTIQVALENSINFNSAYYLASTKEIPPTQKEIEQKEAQDLLIDSKEPPILTMIDGVSTVKEARDYLTKEFSSEVTGKNFPNKTSILNFAATKNIEFPNLL